MRLAMASGLLGLTLILGCSGSTGPSAGTLDLSLTTPHADDGGVLLTITGGPVDSVEATGHRVYLSRPNASTLRLIVAGNLGSGTLARVHIPDTRQASQYVVSIGQIAARSSYAPRDPAPYTISLAP